MTNFLRVVGLCLCLFLSSSAFGQADQQEYRLEYLINQYMEVYDFSPDNRFKLAAYAELKGYYDEAIQGFFLPFGSLGSLSFYPNNCLLKVRGSRIFYLDPHQKNSPQAQAFNAALSDVFERIELLSNYGADEARIAFVNKWLSRKNMQPFDKIFTRHLFLKYGKYDEFRKRVEFHTDWLPTWSQSASLGQKRGLVKHHSSPLKLLLDSINLRGYYTQIGGYVYVQDVERQVAYATGEEYTYNGSAFKVFVQKMLTQSAQYVIEHKAVNVPPATNKQYMASSHTAIAVASSRGLSRGSAPSGQGPDSKSTRTEVINRIKPLYDHSSWIPMMLSLLKSNNISISDPDIIIYFIDQPFFPKLYEMLSREEQVLIDRY